MGRGGITSNTQAGQNANTSTTDDATAEGEKTANTKPGKTGTGKKVNKRPGRLARLFKGSKTEPKVDGNKGMRDRKAWKAPVQPVEGLRIKFLNNDDQRRVIADGVPGYLGGATGLMAGPDINAAIDGIAPQAAEAAEAAVEQTPLKEGSQLLQIVEDAVQAGSVKNEIEALVDSTQRGLNNAAGLEESLGDQKDSLTEILAEKNELLSTAQESQTQVSQQVSNGTAHVNQLQAEAGNLQGSITDQNQIIVEQQNVITELQNNYTAAQNLLDDANQGVDDGYNDAANKSVERLATLLEESQTILADQKAQLANLDSLLDAKNTQLASAQSELAGLQEELAEAQNTVTTLTGESSSLQDQLQLLEQDYADASEQVSVLEGQLSQLITFNEAANEAAETGELETVQDLLAQAKVAAGEADADAAEVAASESAGAAEYISGLFDPASTVIDVGVGFIGHSIAPGLKEHKLSKLKNRQEAFTKYEDVVKRWKGKADSGADTKATVQDLKDYGLVAKLSDSNTAEVTIPLREVLASSKCHFSNDGKMEKLASDLLGIVNNTDAGSKSSDIPKAVRGKPITEQLDHWLKAFKEKAKEHTVSLDGSSKKRLKTGHQSKKLMVQFNAIVKPLGVAMEYKLPTLKKFGQSAIATQHQFVIDEKKLYAHLDKTGKLPSLSDVKKQVVSHLEDAPTLKSFANYEQRKIDHQRSQIKWVAGQLLAAVVPVIKVDNGIRAGREFSEAKFREKNHKILDQKKGQLTDFFEKVVTIHMDEEKKINMQLVDLLVNAFWIIDAKQGRTQIKKRGAIAQGSIDVVAATAGSAIALAAPGVGSLAADVAVGAAKMTVAAVTIGARSRLDKKAELFGRIETQVYRELKAAYNHEKSGDLKSDLLKLTASLFDITEDQAKILFKQSDDRDLVSEKGMIRLRFTNTKVEE